VHDIIYCTENTKQEHTTTKKTHKNGMQKSGHPSRQSRKIWFRGVKL